MTVADEQTYRRARTEEQKRQRLDDILDVTESLLDSGSYRAITLSAIAEQLGYSRANLAHYVGTKEEILLLLYVRCLRQLLDDMQRTDPTDLNVGTPDDMRRSAMTLAALVARHRDFGRIGALLASLIETNVSLECLTACKRDIVEAIDGASRLLVGWGLLADDASAARFLLNLANYAAGLYPAAHPLPIQQEAAAVVGYPIPDYESALASHIAVQLAGHRALQS